ncbi:MAG: iron chaperone, partial [Bacteroidota bacterium]
MRESSAKNIGDYISEFEPKYQSLLIQMWETISTAAPEATEDIKYAMPTFVLNGNLVHFAAFKNHIGFYPGPAAI